MGNAKTFGVLLTVVPNYVQGRALSLLNTIKGFSAPLGLLLAGPIGETLGVRAIHVWGSAVALSCAYLAYSCPLCRVSSK